MTACERCHKRKTRCDRNRPACDACIKSAVRCSYPEYATYRLRNGDHLKLMEQRIRDLEQENQRLRAVEPTSSQIENAQEQENTTWRSPPSTGSKPQSDALGNDVLSTSQTRAQSQTQQRFQSQNQSQLQTQQQTQQHTSQQFPQAAIATTPGNHHSRYLGTNAGVEFVDLVERVVDSPNSHGDLFARITDAYCRPRTPEHHDLSSPPLPARVAASQLIASYFEHWHLTFPLLYRPAFLELVNSIYEEPGFQEKNTHSLFVFNMVLALGSATSKRFEWTFKDTEMYYRKALSHLDEILGYRDIRTLQALLLCCQYGIHASLRDTADEMWDLLGKAERMCVQLGLHQLRSTARMVKCDIHLTGPIPDALQVEMQRRCFWCFYSLDRIVSITLARPLTPADDDIDTPLPSPLDDEELKSQLGSSDQTSDLCQLKLSPFLQLIKLRKIVARIHRSFYTSVPTRSLLLQDKLAMRRSFMLELDAWRNNIPNLQLSGQISSSLSSFSYPTWYEALYNSAVLLMFRPSRAFGPEESQDLGGQDDALKMTWQSSRLIIKSYKKILQTRRLNYSWICLYTIFMAGLANIYAVGQSAQRRKTDFVCFLPDWTEVMVDVQDCSNILTAICERWDDARSSCEIFNRLSASAFRELMKVTTRSQQVEMSSLQHGSSTNPDMQSGIHTGMHYSSAFPDSANGHAGQIQIFPARSEAEEVMGFQDLFQDMQNNVFGGGYDGSNEVIMGLDRDWFERG